MIRKFMLALLLCCMLVSCGKKGDPEYKETLKKTNLQLVIIKKA